MKNIFTFTVFLLISISILAQTDSVRTTLSEIVVTATRTETPSIAIGSSVSVITSLEISKRQLNTVVDVLRELPGLSVIQQGGPGKLSYVFLRGANTNHTLVILDGVVMNDPASPNNAFDFSYLNINDIDRIEVVRGPQSTLYGSDAIAGVINIITKNGNAKPEYSFYGETGSNGYFRGNLSALGQIGFLDYAITATRNGSNGVSAADSKFGNTEKDGYSNDAFTSHFKINLQKNIFLNLLYKFTKAESALDQNEKFGDDPNFNYNLEEQLFSGGIKLSLLDGKWEQTFNASLLKHFTHSLDLPDQFRPKTSSDAFNNAQRTKFEWQNNLKLIEHNLIILGLESSLESAYTSYYSTSDYGPYESVFPEQSIRTTGFFLQDQIDIAQSFFSSIGLRYDYNQKFGGVTTFRIAPAYFIHPTETKLKFSFGTGFKAPSLFYLFDPMFGNPDLKPEKSKGWDAGVEQFFLNGKISFGLTYFDLRLENMFGFDANYKTINIAKASSRGIEFTTSIKSNEGLVINANYTFTQTNDDYELSSDFNKPLLRRPKHQFEVNANWQANEKLNMNFEMHYVGKRDDKDFSTYPAQRITMPDFTLFNVAASYKLFDYLKINARIENLFDKQYEEVLYYGTLGRSFYAGLSLTF